jgi:hypothetical protein
LGIEFGQPFFDAAPMPGDEFAKPVQPVKTPLHVFGASHFGSSKKHIHGTRVCKGEIIEDKRVRFPANLNHECVRCGNLNGHAA